MGSIFWLGFSNSERHHIITIVRETIACFGDIVDVKFFSDISIVITIEIKEQNIDNLFNELKKHIQLDESDRLNSRSDKERVVYLNLTFTRATGDFKVNVPPVPG